MGKIICCASDVNSLIRQKVYNSALENCFLKTSFKRQFYKFSKYDGMILGIKKIGTNVIKPGGFKLETPVGDSSSQQENRNEAVS
jgi:hypothetical protein